MKKQNVITLKLTKEQIDDLEKSWGENSHVKTPNYAIYQLKLENCVITAYESFKVVFQGEDAEVYASSFMQEYKDTLPQAGSDEVGTGDYFGPVCVCASYIDSNNYKFVHNLGVKDSKNLTDTEIRKIAPLLMEKVIYSSLVLMPSKYNKVHETNNLNVIKAKMHNQAYINLSKKIELPDFLIIDQFAEKNLYYHYLNTEKTVIKNIHFETKAENKYISVATSSIIARYTFLIAMDKMKEEYGMTFQKGGGELATECARNFIKKYGKERLNEVAKLHFKNTMSL